MLRLQSHRLAELRLHFDDAADPSDGICTLHIKVSLIHEGENLDYPYRFDVEKWRRRISLAELRRENEFFDIGLITGPTELVVVEESRATLREVMDLGRPVPADVFIFAEGEPEIRHATKLGGLPYFPRAAAWPMYTPPHETAADGWVSDRPFKFFFQICFSASDDIVGRLPGDVLLIFADDLSFGQPGSLHFVWQPLGIMELITASDIPESKIPCDPAYGYVFRTADFPEAATRTQVNSRIDRYSSIMGATKIGGVPLWIQGSRKVRGRFLATIASLEPNRRLKFPLVNLEGPLDRAVAKRKTFEVGDAGHIHLFIDDEGGVSWVAESY